MVLLYVVWRGSLVKGSARWRGYRAPKAPSWGPGGFAAVALAWHRRNFAIGRCARVEAKEENALMTHGKCRRCSSNVERSSARDEKTVIYPVCLQLYFSAMR